MDGLTFKTENHGRYNTRSGPLGGRWGSNGYRKKLRVAQAIGSDRDEAVEAVKGELDRLDEVGLASRDDEGAPAAEVYERAFLAVLHNIPNSYRAMLRAHLTAPHHLLSTTKLAEAAGCAGYEGANLHYGKLGLLIATEIGFKPPKRDDGSEIRTAAIARNPASDPDFLQTSLRDSLSRTFGTAHFQSQLRPQVRAGVEKSEPALTTSTPSRVLDRPSRSCRDA